LLFTIAIFKSHPIKLLLFVSLSSNLTFSIGLYARKEYYLQLSLWLPVNVPQRSGGTRGKLMPWESPGITEMVSPAHFPSGALAALFGGERTKVSKSSLRHQFKQIIKVCLDENGFFFVLLRVAWHEVTQSDRQFTDRIGSNFGTISQATLQSVASCKYPFSIAKNGTTFQVRIPNFWTPNFWPSLVRISVVQKMCVRFGKISKCYFVEHTAKFRIVKFSNIQFKHIFSTILASLYVARPHPIGLFFFSDKHPLRGVFIGARCPFFVLLG
jgi:hypothetical protein